jgi:hypothetical protein
MALIEYDIQYGSGQPKITCTVVQVDKGDRVLFKSGEANTAVRYKGQSPFRDGAGPQADEVFKVGETAGPFEVTVPSYGPPRKFDCGEIAAAKAEAVGYADATTSVGFKIWDGAGGDTP